MKKYEKVDLSLLDIYNFISSESCRLSSYAIREGFSYFTEYALKNLKDDKHRLIMLAYYIVNCDERDFPLHLPVISKEVGELNFELFGVSLTELSLYLKKIEMYNELLSLGALHVEIKSSDREKMDILKDVFSRQYDKHNSHSEYLKMFKHYMLLDERYSDIYSEIDVRRK